VLEVRKDQTTIEEDGKKRVLVIGQHYRGVPPPPAGTPGANKSAAATDPSKQIAVLTGDSAGHFYGIGAMNGMAVRFLVDTGATLIALPGSEAQRMGLDYRKGKRGLSNTANGTVAVYQIKLDTVKVGGIELNNVDALVIEEGLGVVLLGMSFLNRVQMQREGDSMTLTRRF
jgi:aspartyl protease family protein